MRYFFHIAYNGAQYHGWQRHAPHLTIQEVLEENLSKVLKMPATILGCGRTDAQVHANQYFFHLDVKNEWDFDLVFRLNKMLPEDIAVYDIIQVSDDSHAQYSATKRTYDYFIHTCKNPFLNRFSTYYPERDLALDKMQTALSLLTKHRDYKAFCKTPDKYEHTNCRITSAQLFSDKKGDKLRIQISSNRFLRGMIRAITAKLLKIGSVELSLNEFENILSASQFQPNLEFAEPQGLYLSEVVYPFLNVAPRREFTPFFRHEEEKHWLAV